MPPVALPTNTVAVLQAAKDLRIENRSLWPPGAMQAQVQVVTTGLCGSDLHYWSSGRNGDFTVSAPLILGHEAAGIVKAVGPGVSNVVPGQRVAIEAGIYCRTCDFCKKGRYNLCKAMRFCSSAAVFPHLDGTLQSRMNHPAFVLHPLPDECSFELAALAEPLSVLIHASRRAKLDRGQTVLVFGVGAIGILACALAHALGAAHVVAVDINQTRLDFAKSNGFVSDTFCLPKNRDSCCSKSKSTTTTTSSSTSSSTTTKTAEEQLRFAAENARSLLNTFDQPNGFDVVFECTGAESAIQTAVHSAISGGKVMLIGMGTRNLVFPLSSAALREVDIQGSFRYTNTYPEALKLLASRKLKNVEKLITHRFSLRDTNRAFELMTRGQDEDGQLVLKVMIEPSSHCLP